jgi:hypothetical protein
VKHALVVAVLFGAVASESRAQGADINTRWGPSGSHLALSPGTQTFGYQATITGVSVPFEVHLEVYHNGVLKFTNSNLVPIPVSPYFYSCSVGMGTWGLCSGDVVTFVLKVKDTASGATLATHTLYGDVAGT